MTYASGGLIQAADFNSLAGGSTANVSGEINSIWATGNGNAGWGQTAVANVAASGTVTAASQWTSLITAVNNARLHTLGTGSGLAAPASGGTIAWLNGVASNTSLAYTNRLSTFAYGTTITGSTYTASATAATNVNYPETTLGAYRYVTFSSGNACRYFFNAGGKINFVVTNVVNNDATARSASARTLLLTNFAGWGNFAAYTSSGRTGTGGTVNTNLTSYGYYNLSPGGNWTYICQITSTTASYTADFMKFYMASTTAANLNGNGDNGSTLQFAVNFSSPAHTWNASLNITMSYRIDIIPPETTYLTNSWGTPTVT